MRGSVFGGFDFFDSVLSWAGLQVILSAITKKIVRHIAQIYSIL